MNSPTATTIYNKLTKLDAEVQRLKLDAYFSLPKKSRLRSAIFDNETVRKLKLVGRDLTQKDIDDAVRWARSQKQKM